MDNLTNNKGFLTEMGWSSRIYFLLAGAIIINAFFFNAWEISQNWTWVILVSGGIVFIVEFILLFSKRHADLAYFLGWGLLLIAFLLLLTGIV